jgi:hypothetical protein
MESANTYNSAVKKLNDGWKDAIHYDNITVIFTRDELRLLIGALARRDSLPPELQLGGDKP